MKKVLSLMLALALMGSLFSCTSLNTSAKKGTAAGSVVGAAAGAIIGQAVGRDTESTLWGAAIGGVVGGLTGNRIGNYMDQQESRLQAISARSEAISTSRNMDVLTATFKSDVLFDYDSSDMKPGAFVEISRVATMLNDFPETVLRVDGHTDSTGSEEYNQRLSERRAESVRNALIQRSVHPDRIEHLGYGETMPISSVNALNRRVEIQIVPVTL